MTHLVSRAATRLAALMSVSLASAAWSQSFQFTIDPEASGLAANLGFDVATSGELLGDWDPATNPAGTRTRPGLFGAFGAGENAPVAVALGLSLAGDLDTAASGSMELSLDTSAGTIALEAFEADLLAGGAVGLPAIVSVDPEAFRTAGPASAFGGLPLQIPAGEVVITAMSLERGEGGAPGVLSEVAEGRYAFSVAAPAVLHSSFSLNGWPVEISAPVAVTVSGEITVSGETAQVTSVYSIDHAEWQEPAVALPQFAIEAPTVTPVREAAHLLASLTLDELGTSLVGELTLAADGVRVCDADFNGDGATNTLDFVAFLGEWSVRREAADFNADGRVDARDVVEYLDAWSAGC